MMKKIIIASLIGGIAGLGLSYLLSCVGGSWQIFRNPLLATVIGAILGGLFVSGGDEEGQLPPEQASDQKE